MNVYYTRPGDIPTYLLGSAAKYSGNLRVAERLFLIHSAETAEGEECALKNVRVTCAYDTINFFILILVLDQKLLRVSEYKYIRRIE